MDRAVDILHPLASLEWRECREAPVAVLGDAHAVLLKDKVYIGGGWTLGNRRSDARLYIYTPAADTWTTLNTPVYRFSLTIYHSQLVIVGGREYIGDSVTGELTNKLWTLSEEDQWQETLPPMPTLCIDASAVSLGDHLLVINDDYPNKVYVYNGHHWVSAQHPPRQLYFIKSTIFNGHWYLMGRGGTVYSASLDSLLASCQPSETSQPSSLWKRLADVPSGWCYPAVFGNRLVAVVRGSTFTPSLYAYSFLTQSWVHMEDAPSMLIYIPSITTPCAVLLPSNELMIVSRWTAFQSRHTLTPFDPENPFTLRAVSLLESAAGIPVRRTLSSYTETIEKELHIHVFSPDLDTLLTTWLGYPAAGNIPPSWRNLFDIIRLLNQDELAQRMETYLCAGATEETNEMEIEEVSQEEEDGVVEAQLQLREQTIYHLKQEMASLRENTDSTIFMLEERIKEQMSEIEELRCQLGNQKEDKPFTLKTEFKVEPHTLLKGEPVSLLPVKKEIKEEAIPMTKSETSAQSTTAIWNLRGVEVCGETTVVIYSSHHQQFIWPGYGLRLNIPKGCLPAGMEQCTVNIKASLAGQYEFPENSNLVSAIFWLRCEDVHQFTRPIMVEIQHCTKLENVTNTKLSFVRAVCSQRQLPYTFKQLPGGNFTSHSSYGIIELNSFSGVGVAQEGSEDKEYCSQLFYLGHLNPCKIHFVVTWNIDAHLTVIKDIYEKKGAVHGIEQLVEFEGDSITVDIPKEGTTVKGWKITPLISPVVTKKQVDNFRVGKMIPRCQLKAEVFGRRRKIPVLNHQFLLQGARQPYNFFTLELPIKDPNSTQTSGDLSFAEPGPPSKKRSKLESDAGSSSTSGLDTKLELSAHYKVVGYLRKLDDRQIRYVGGALGLAYNTLDKMKDVPSEMAAAWLRREDYVMAASGEPTWRSLVNALRKEGKEGTAIDIEEKEK